MQFIWFNFYIQLLFRTQQRNLLAARQLSKPRSSFPYRRRPTLDVLTGLSVSDERGFSLKQMEFKQTIFSCAPAKKPEILENIPDPGRSSQVAQRLHTHTTYRGRWHACEKKGLLHMQRYLQRDPTTADGLFG